MVTVLPYSKPALNERLRALSPNIHSHPIALAAAGRGSKPNASPKFIFVVVGTDRDRKTGALMALLAHSDGLKYAGAAFITLGGDERKEFLAEVERLTTSWGSSHCEQRT